MRQKILEVEIHVVGEDEVSSMTVACSLAWSLWHSFTSLYLFINLAFICLCLLSYSLLPFPYVLCL